MSDFSTGSIHGSRISDFNVEGIVIGTGGFSEVVNATSRLTGQRVAIKFIRNEKPENLKRVLSEIQIHQPLMHPSIVSFYGRFQDENFVYVVMELCEEDLERYLGNLKAQNLTIDPKRAKEIIWQIVRGLEYLHGIGIIHRDLKPGNILLKDKGRTAKICDFGLATAASNSTSFEKVSQRNSTFCGTPDFMAPEMFVKTKDRTIDYSADIYSLGVLIYTMLTGVRPFNSNGKTISEIGEERHSPEIDFTRITDPSAQDLVRRTMRHKGEGRRPSAKEILKHPWLAEIAEEKARMMSELSSSLDSGNGSDMSRTSSNNSRHRCSNLSAGTPDRVLGVITESSISGCNLAASSLNFSFLDSKRKPSTLSENSRSSGYSGSSSHALQRLMPVDTQHLKAQRVKVGETVVCSILESGEVVVEFLDSHSGELWVTDVIRMGAGSSEVLEYEPADRTRLKDTPPPVPAYRFQAHQLPNLPGKVRKGCLIATAFVDLVKSKTVKHWICTDKARANLMRNEPFPNVESNFYDGIKIVHGEKKIQVKKDNQNVQVLYPGPPHPELKPHLLDHWEHHVWCRNHLLDKDRQTRALEKSNPDIKIIAMGYGRKPVLPQLLHTVGQSASDMPNTTSQPPAAPQVAEPSRTALASGLGNPSGQYFTPRTDSPSDRTTTPKSDHLKNGQSSDGVPVTGVDRSSTERPNQKIFRFDDGMNVTVYSAGEFLKFENSTGSHTWIRQEVPQEYQVYIEELQRKGHLY